jgi:transposase
VAITSYCRGETAVWRTELARLCKQVAEQEKDIAFRKMVSAYFVASQPK